MNILRPSRRSLRSFGGQAGRLLLSLPKGQDEFMLKLDKFMVTFSTPLETKGPACLSAEALAKAGSNHVQHQLSDRHEK